MQDCEHPDEHGLREPTPEEAEEAQRQFNELIPWKRAATHALFLAVIFIPITPIVLITTLWRGPSAPYQRAMVVVTLVLGLIAFVVPLLAYGASLKRAGGLAIGSMDFQIRDRRFSVSPLTPLALLLVLDGALGYAAFEKPWSYAFLIPVILMAYARLRMPFLFR